MPKIRSIVPKGVFPAAKVCGREFFVMRAARVVSSSGSRTAAKEWLVGIVKITLAFNARLKNCENASYSFPSFRLAYVHLFAYWH